MQSAVTTPDPNWYFLYMADFDDDMAHNGAGHRARLRARLLDKGGETLADYELIEYLLALVIPRRDTKPLAKQLIKTYGSFAKLLAADVANIAQQPGMGETSVAALKVVQTAALRMLSEPVRTQPILASWQSLLDYLRADMAQLSNERVRILYLNARNMLIRDEIASEGSIDQAPVYIREIIRRAIDLGATAIILVHNHPSGDSAPSRQDISMTRDIVDAGRKLGISVHDHIIIGQNGFSSMRSAGLI